MPGGSLLPRRRRMLSGFSLLLSMCLRSKNSFQAFSDLKALAGIRAVAKPSSLANTALLAS